MPRAIPKKRWYGGCEYVDVVEQLAIERAKQLFGADHANVQPHSGSQANAAVYFAMLQPGDLILTMDLSHGGHLTHGHKMNFSGRFYRVVHYGVSKETETIDYDALEAQAKEVRPKMITAGASAYSRIIDFPRLRQIADSCGALLFIDMAHIAGLVAAGVHPSPMPYADFVTTTTHKTLRGPRGGLVLCKEKFAKEIDSQVFPGVQGGPLMHVIAAKAVALGEALQPEFKAYQQQVVRNAKALCEGMKKNGFRIVSGTTDNHLMLVDLQPKNITGKEVSELLDQAGITVNKNAIPFDTQSPFKAGGIRLGTPAVTTRGMKEDEMFDIANLIEEAVEHRADAAKIKRDPRPCPRNHRALSAAVLGAIITVTNEESCHHVGCGYYSLPIVVLLLSLIFGRTSMARKHAAQYFKEYCTEMKVDATHYRGSFARDRRRCVLLLRWTSNTRSAQADWPLS